MVAPIDAVVTSTKALLTLLADLIAAVIAVAVVFGADISKEQEAAVLNLVLILAAVVIFVVGWMHHNRTKVAAAERRGLAVERLNRSG